MKPCRKLWTRTLAAGVAACAAFALGHDNANSPHMSCALARDGTDSLTCLYERHPAPAARPSRAGYADKGRYVLSCPLNRSASQGRSFTTEACRAGAVVENTFQCWTKQRRDDWLANDANVASERETSTQLLSFQGFSLQKTLLKLLTHPDSVGRPHFVAQDSATVDGIRRYAETCGLAASAFSAAPGTAVVPTLGTILSVQDVANLLPTLALFGALRHDTRPSGRRATTR